MLLGLQCVAYVDTLWEILVLCNGVVFSGYYMSLIDIDMLGASAFRYESLEFDRLLMVKPTK